MGSVGLVYPQKARRFPNRNLPHVPRCQRLGSCLGGGPMSCRIVVVGPHRTPATPGRQRQKNIFEKRNQNNELPKVLNQQTSKKHPPKDSNQKNSVHHQVPPKKLHHPICPQSTRQLKMVALDAQWPRVLLRANVWLCWSSWGNSVQSPSGDV